MKMKNIQKLTLVIALLSHTAFASISADYRLLDALNTANPSLATIQKLLTIPAVKDNINLQDSNSMTALMYAVSAANLPLTQALIAAGAKTTPPADQANNSDTALFIAVSQETPSLPIVKVLLQAPDIKDSINLQNSAGLTALMWAANKGNLPITKALLAAGANPTIMTPQGQTAWSFAAPNCQSLLPIPPSAKANSDLLNAVFNNDLPGVKKALAAGANPSKLLPPITGTTTNSVLILAIGLNFTAIAQTLIAAKANVHFQNSQGQTALTEAANHGNLELVNSLIAAKANVNIQESTGATALIYAADKGNLPLVNILLAAGANPNLQTNAANGSTTALIIAANRGNTAMVKALASIKGINANIQDNTGMTAVMYAAQNNSLPILKLLVKIPGININLENNNANTSCFLGTGCAAFDFITDQKCTDFLTQQGAISGFSEQ